MFDESDKITIQRDKRVELHQVLEDSSDLSSRTQVCEVVVLVRIEMRGSFCSREKMKTIFTRKWCDMEASYRRNKAVRDSS